MLAIGKERDALELPFPVLDDGTEERAAVHGLIAGLRAASNDVCIVLPVDCPLVTPEALRALAEAVAVPQTGPLPGAYSKAHAPRARGSGSLVASSRSEASTRTCWSSTQSLLENVNTRMELMTAAVADWAREKDDVRTLLLVGSQARAEVPADRWSDLDLIFIVEDPSVYHDDASWIHEFGVPLVTFLEPKPDGHSDRRVLYETGEEVDFVFFPASVLERFGASESVAGAPGPRLPAARRPRRHRGCARAERSQAETPRVRRSTTSTSSRATSGTTRSGPRRSFGGARSSPRSNVSTGT